MTIKVDDRTLGTWTRGRHSGNTFNYARRGRDIVGKVGKALGDGEHKLTGVAEYRGGEKLTHSIPVILDRSFNDRRFVPYSSAVIRFQGRGRTGPKLKLAEDGRRGDMIVKLESTSGLKAGDCLFIEGPATERWKKLTKNVCRGGNYRRYEVLVDRVKGNTIRIGQPLRSEFRVLDAMRRMMSTTVAVVAGAYLAYQPLALQAEELAQKWYYRLDALYPPVPCKIADVIGADAGRDDTVFVWGHSPEIVWRLHRPYPTRFVGTHFFELHGGLGQPLFDEMLDALRRTSPRYLVLDSDPADLGGLVHLIESAYDPWRIVGGNTIYRLRRGDS